MPIAAHSAVARPAPKRTGIGIFRRCFRICLNAIIQLIIKEPQGAAMENDYYINKMNISHYQALLRTNLDEKKRDTVNCLLSDLENHVESEVQPKSDQLP